MRKYAKKVLLGLSIALIAALAFWAFFPAPFDVDVAQPIKGPIRVTVDQDGEIRARDRYVVAAPIAAKLSQVRPRMGDRITPGTWLARLEPLPFSADEREEHLARIRHAQAKFEDARTAMAAAREAMEQAQREELRMAESLDNSDPARQAHEQAKLELQRTLQDARGAAFRADAAAADLRATELALKLGEDSGRVLDLMSPVEGTITKIFETSAQPMRAGTPLMTISDTTRMEVVVPVLTADAVKIKRGMPMLLEKWGGERTLRVKVREIEPASFSKISALGVEEQRVNVLADLVGVPLPQGEGYRLEARVLINEKAEVMKVPSSAVFREGEGWAVFVVVGNQARKTPVVPGLRNAAEVEIVSGLDVTARVVVNPVNTMKDGARVSVRRAPH